MNYLWEILIGSKEQGLDTSNLKFKLPGSYSPYMEYAGPILNLQKIEDMNVEINPYYRFLNIFKELFPPDGGEFEELRESLLNLSMHLLGVGDVKQGISKIDYYKRLLYKDILAGCFDDEVAKNILLFDKMERNQFSGMKLVIHILHKPESIKVIWVDL